MEMGSCDVGDSLVSLHNSRLDYVKSITRVGCLLSGMGCGVMRVMHLRSGFGGKKTWKDRNGNPFV